MQQSTIIRGAAAKGSKGQVRHIKYRILPMNWLIATEQEGVIDTHVLVGASLPAAGSQCHFRTPLDVLFLTRDPACTAPTNPVYGNPCKAVNLPLNIHFDPMTILRAVEVLQLNHKLIQISVNVTKYASLMTHDQS